MLKTQYCSGWIPSLTYGTMITSRSHGMIAAQTLHAAKGRYRPEIDGLRAFAVIAVIINHFNKDILPGGYLGVDIFFVISGYVITSSLLGRPSKDFKDFISGFYERRIKRLVPALSIFVLITSIAICLLNPLPGMSLRTGVTSLFGLSNIFLFQQSTDYFAQSTELNVFTHTWSLGVEEQFYILFPFLVWFSGFGRQTKNGARNLFVIVAVLTIASLIGFLYFYSTNQPAAYFLMPSRFWEMAAGCLIFVGFQKRPSIEQFLEKWPPFLLMALIVGVMYLPTSMATSSTIAIVALSCILIACLKQQTSAFKFLTNPMVVYIGLISYSLYLWHWGVLSISRWTIGVHWWSVPFQIALMLGLAVASYRWIETPLRKGNWFGHRWKTLLSGGFLILMTALTLVYFGKSRVIQIASNRLGIIRIDPETTKLDQDIPGTTISRDNCHKMQIKESADFVRIINMCNHNFSSHSSSETISVFLGGDSHSYMLRPALYDVSKDLGLHLYSVSGHSFPPNRTRKGGNSGKGTKLTEDYMAYIRNNSNSRDVVIISNRLSWMFSEGYSINKDDFKNFDLRYEDSVGRKLTNDQALEIWSAELYDYVQSLANRGVRVIYILPFPEFTRPASNCLSNTLRPLDCQKVSKELLRKRYSNIYSALRNIESEVNGFQLLDPFEILCKSNYCSMVDEGSQHAIFNDSNHISNHGSMLLAPAIRELIN